jgi:hypothetical protein
MKKKCPLIGKACLEQGCEFYTHLLGLNPQTGVQEDKWGCAVNFLPILLIETAGTVRKAQASTDKVATEVRKQHMSFVGALPLDAQKRLLDADPKLQIGNQAEGD